MIVGIGTDLVDVERFALALERTPTLRERLFTPAEAESALESLAGRFAAKEALAKALGCPGGLVWRHAEVVRTPGEAPRFHLTGTVAAAARRRGVTRVHLSISHDGGLATALVLAEGAGADPTDDG